MTIYVERIIYDDISFTYMERRRITVIDVEIPITKAHEMVEYLHKRIDNNLPGAIRLRLYGNLVLG